MLVFQGTEGVLEGNPDLRQVITVKQKASPGERLRDARRLWRRYDLACAALSSDRARSYAWLAGRKRVGLVDPERVNWWTRSMLHGIALNQRETVHTVCSSLALADIIGVDPLGEVVPPGLGDSQERQARFEAKLGTPSGASTQPYVVLHPYPMYAYKQWQLEGWVDLIRWMHAHGFAVSLSGGPAEAEREYAKRIAAHFGGAVRNLVGMLSFAESAELIRRARLFVGPDTGATHVAAATGTPTIALFGPSDPVRWGPWPKGWPANTQPWTLRGSGRRGNVYLLQGDGDCVPCRLEGCERRLDSYSNCLTTLGVRRVTDAAVEMLGLPKDALAVQPVIVAAVPVRPD